MDFRRWEVTVRNRFLGPLAAAAASLGRTRSIREASALTQARRTPGTFDH